MNRWIINDFPKSFETGVHCLIYHFLPTIIWDNCAEIAQYLFNWP